MKERMKKLVEERTNSVFERRLYMKRFEELHPLVKQWMEDYLNRGQVIDLEMSDYSVVQIMEDHKVDYIDGLFMMDWIVKEGEGARKAIEDDRYYRLEDYKED